MRDAKPTNPALVKCLCGLGGVLSALSFVLGKDGYVGLSEPPASSTSYLWSALALLFGLLYWLVYGKKALRPTLKTSLIGLLFGIANAFGSYLFAYDSWAKLADFSALALMLFRALGQSLPMTAAFLWLHACLAREGPVSVPGAFPPWLQRLARAYGRHPLLSVMGVLLLCWAPYLLAFFPGTVCWDLGEMAAQFFGMRELDTWHPVFLTWVFGGLIWFGRLFSSDNLGAALFTLLQSLVLSYALARALLFMKKAGAGRGLRLGSLAFFALCPLFAGYAQFISKDTLYSSFLLLYTLSLGEVLLGREQDAPPRFSLLFGLFGWGLLSCLCRNNGLYVVAPTSLMLMVFGAKGKNRLPLAAFSLTGLLCALLFFNALLPALGVKDETASGLYSVCFQQSARVLRDHPEEVTPESFAEIDRVLDGPELSRLYEPNISDPVKYTFKFYGQGAAVEKEALARYRKTWAAMFREFPLTYAEAFFAGNTGYYAFIPKIEGPSYNDQAGNRLVFETYDVGREPEYLHTTQADALAGTRTLLAIFARGWRHLPLFSLLYCCAAYTWLLAGCCCSLWRRKRFRRLVAFLPSLLTLGVCLLSPVNDYFRYFLPIVLMTPPLLALSQERKMKGAHGN